MSIKNNKNINQIRFNNNNIVLAKINGKIVFNTAETELEKFYITYQNNILNFGGLLNIYDFYYADQNGNILEDYEKICDTNIYTYFNKLNKAPKGAETIVACAKNTKNVKAIANIPDTLKMSDLGTKLYSFGALSDVHIDGDGMDEGYASQDFEKALNFLNNKGAVFVGISGDLTREPQYGELELYKNIVDKVDGVPVYACRGNHDCRYSLQDWDTYIGTELQFTIAYQNDKFIFLSMASEGTENYGDGCLTTTQLNWLEEQLQASKNQRVFLFFHVFDPDTGCGNVNNLYPWDGLDENSSNIQRFLNLMRNNKNVIYFSGHSHLDFNCQRFGANANVYDENDFCKRVHIPSCSRPRQNDTGNSSDGTYDNNLGSQGYLIDVYENAIVLRGYDFQKDKFLPIAQYLMNTTFSVEEPEEPDDNLFDASTAPTMNWYIDGTEIGEYSSDNSTYMEIEPNTKYEITKSAGQRFRIGTTVDIPQPSNDLLQYTENDTGTTITITTASNVNYLVIYFIDTSLEDTTVDEMKNSIVVKKVQS